MAASSGSTHQDNDNLASFYTPRAVAQALTNWAIADSRATVLDPSYGGCAFLYAAAETLRRRGNPMPGRQIYGVDIDSEARSHLKPLFSSGATEEQFATDDFFRIDPEHFGRELVSVVVGNPPYIRHHDIPKDSHERAITRLDSLGIQVSGRASYWAFFLLYSMQFLRPGGRLALVLPGALLHTDYSTQVRQSLTEHFEEVTIFLLQQRIFENTEEETVLICAAGARKPHTSLRVGTVATVEDLTQALADPQSSTVMVGRGAGDGGWLRALIQPQTLDTYDQLLESPSVVRMGEWVKTRIGVVTGNNRFFVLSRDEQRESNIPDEFFVHVIRRATYLKGVWVRDGDLEDNGSQSLLLKVTQKDLESGLPETLKEYIRYGEKTGVSEARKCSDRQPWYAVPHTFVPPAFVPCMSASWPRLVVNQSHYTCTNNILRVFWRNERPGKDWLRVALGTLSTLSQLSAEFVGRSYGGGVLKVEPSELARLAVPLVPLEVVDELAKSVDSLLRTDRSKATEAVDAALLESEMGLTPAGLGQLRSARDRLYFRRRHRYPEA